MRLRCIAATIALVCTLTACTGTPAAETPSSAPPVEASPVPSVAATEGSAANPAGRTHAWPNGVSVTLDKVERVPNSWSWEVPDTDALLKVTFTVGNSGANPVPLGDEQFVTVLYGPNRTEAKWEAGYARHDSEWTLKNQDPPTRVAAGGRATLWRGAQLPKDQLGVLAVRVTVAPAAQEEGDVAVYMFTDVEKMLTGRAG